MLPGFAFMRNFPCNQEVRVERELFWDPGNKAQLALPRGFGATRQTSNLFAKTPEGLRPEALNVWNWYKEHLRGSRLYRPELARQFALLCTYEAWLEKYDILNMEPSVVGATGDIKVNPDLKAYNMMMGKAQQLWNTLCIDAVYLFSRPATIDMQADSEPKEVDGGRVVMLHPGRGMPEHPTPTLSVVEPEPVE